ncbi:TIR domain-containing protein [Nonomuraea insulae]|uniref:TIR domain-containing protein n=1 Tax=Nonomuraea insulae TaxID=1616787 RepID=A0ABW1DGR4_9ACTN
MGSVRLVRDIEEMRSQIDDRMDLGRKIQEAPRKHRHEILEFQNQFLDWDDYNSSLLQGAFEVQGSLTVSPKSEYGIQDIHVLNIKLGAVVSDERTISIIEAALEAKLRTLASIRNRLPVWSEVASVPELKSSGDGIFLVHGRDHGMREAVRGFLERLTSRSVIVLDETAGAGSDILGKLLAQAIHASYAVVLLTGDDEGCLAGSGDVKRRARQNVILELGLFIGLLGRDKVTVLYEDGVEIPSDYLGVSYVELDHSKGWQLHLARELRAAGIEASLNRIL